MSSEEEPASCLNALLSGKVCPNSRPLVWPPNSYFVSCANAAPDCSATNAKTAKSGLRSLLIDVVNYSAVQHSHESPGVGHDALIVRRNNKCGVVMLIEFDE